jgi:leucyl-tRNA synthetase
MYDRYSPGDFEAKWRERWLKADLFRTREEAGRPKFYTLDFFPYPSGAGLSVGHCRNYVPTDVLSRMKYMQGFNVLHPMGFDAFGLPAENEAIKRKSHPAPMIEKYAANYKRQMDLIGCGFDWHRSFKSSDPSYYKWTQWIFGLLYERGLAVRKLAAVNWDPVDKTVLADEEVIAGRAERSGALVEKKWIPQWYFRITEYAQELIDDLDTIDWPEGIKAMQRNWIGRSEGCQFTFRVVGTANEARIDLDTAIEHGEARPQSNGLHFDVFTTRIDTIYGVTFCVLAPEHGIIEHLPITTEDRERIKQYQESAKALSDTDRTAENREKTGVFTGAYAHHPFTGERIPIWLADYVLATYGTGAIMAVPGHDQRDFDFATKFRIPIEPVIIGPGGLDEIRALRAQGKAFEPKDGTLINSSHYDGLSVLEAQEKLGIRLESEGIGERKIQYKLRDWLISRQRYWGCPIPVIHTKDGEEQLVPLSQLPVELPMVDSYEPAGDGSSPLAHIDDFVNCTDLDGSLARRETDTMGGFACSSWYFLRFCDPENFEAAFDPEKIKYWMPVDCYVGGAEHAVMHLLYARFWTKVLYDAGVIPVKEPFQTLRNQGQVLAMSPYRKPREGEVLGVAEDGILVSFEEAKLMPEADLTWKWVRMSKSKGNVVTPDEAVEQYGADALRMYLLFVAPFHADVQWSNEGMQGISRFLGRIFKFAGEVQPHFAENWQDILPFEELDDLSKRIRRATHQTIRNCTKDLENFGFNTYVSWLMKFMNEITECLELAKPRIANERHLQLAMSEALETLILLVAPSAPHSADQIWEDLGKEGFTYHAHWPTHDDDLAAEDSLTIAVQVNGKLRDTITVPANTPKEQIEAEAQASVKVKIYTDGKEVKKVITVPGRLVNIVVAG